MISIVITCSRQQAAWRQIHFYGLLKMPFSVLPERRLLLPFLSLPLPPNPIFFFFPPVLQEKERKSPADLLFIESCSTPANRYNKRRAAAGINEVPGNSAGACHAQAPAGSEPGMKPKYLFAGVNSSSTFLISLRHQRCVAPPGDFGCAGGSTARFLFLCPNPKLVAPVRGSAQRGHPWGTNAVPKGPALPLGHCPAPALLCPQSSPWGDGESAVPRLLQHLEMWGDQSEGEMWFWFHLHLIPGPQI